MAGSTALADLVLRGGRIWTGANHTGPVPTAVAVRDGKVLAVGTDQELDPLAERTPAVVDLGGRWVLPGLQDSHMHAVRAGLTWERELHWEDVRTLREGLELIRRRAAALPEDAWISVVGGWHARQLAERRLPTRSELDEAGGGRPVFVQMLYDAAVMSSAALQRCGWDAASPDPPGGVLERDDRGELTGVGRGMGVFVSALSRIGAPTPEEQRRGTLAMLEEFSRHGVTGVIDAGGFLMTPTSYHPLLSLWREERLPVRLRLFLSAATSGQEVDELSRWMEHTVPGFGDDMVRIAGIGEILHHGCHDMEGLDPYEMDDHAWEQLLEIGRLAAARRWPTSVHAVLDHTLGRVLDAWEAVAAEQDIRSLRFSIVHADQASLRNIERMAALGMGVLVQNRLGLKATDYLASWGRSQTLRTPPIGELMSARLPLAAGTDATRANWYHPWASLWWLVSGGSVDGQLPRSAAHRMSLTQALHAYTAAGAWFTFEEGKRGELLPGQVADLFVPTADPFECEVDALPDLRSDLTVVAGRVTHSSGSLC